MKRREGLVLKWYKDSLGKLTGGYGHLQREGEASIKITQEVADAWLKEDLAEATKAAKDQVSKLPFWTQELEDVLVSVNFQLGTAWYRIHAKTWDLLLKGDYEGAAWEVENSLWAKQTPVRVRDLQRALWRSSLLREVQSSLGA